MDDSPLLCGMLSALVPATVHVYLLSGVVAIGLLWLDALRHLLQSYWSYFGWYRSLTDADKPRLRLSGRPRFVGLRDIVDVPVADAPDDVAARYRRHMLFFLAETVGGMGLGTLLVLVG
jgi:hypothetical protein